MFLGAKYILHRPVFPSGITSIPRKLLFILSVDINPMNMLASYLHILQFAHMNLRLCKQMLWLMFTALMYDMQSYILNTFIMQMPIYFYDKRKCFMKFVL